MADFTQSEVLNEISKIFLATIDPGREGGTLNTRTEYQQLLELTATTFLIHQDAIFYLARLSKNRLNKVLVDEIKVIEDTLVALEDLSQIGKAVTNTSVLYNANSALLALDAAQSVSNRPETKRFSDLMDRYSDELRPSIVSNSTGGLVRPRDNARGIIRVNLARMKTLHTELLNRTYGLRDILQTYIEMDIPSRVATTALTNIRSSIGNLITKTEDGTEVEIITRSRQNLLTALASKTVVNLISSFGDPRRLKIRTPINPLPVNLIHKGRVTGEGEPAYWLSTPGPWELPISDDLSVDVDGGSPQTLALSAVLGGYLKGRNSAPFLTTPSERDLHVVVDPEIKSSPVTTGTVSTALLSTLHNIGFKHLGALVSFDGGTDTDLNPRVITEMRDLQVLTIDNFNASDNTVEFSGASAADESSSLGIQDRHVGCYLEQGGTRWEILYVFTAGLTGEAVLSVPQGTATPTPGACNLRGQTSVAAPAGTKFTFSPATTTGVTGNCSIGPTMKTVQFSLGTRTVPQMLADVVAETGDTSNPYQVLHRHIKVVASPSDTNKLALEIRSTLNPFVQISSLFLKPNDPTAPMSIVELTAHKILGFLLGEKNDTGLVRSEVLTVKELVNLANRDLTGISATVDVTELHSGDSLKSVRNTSMVQDSFVDFTTFVSAGDQIEIINGNTSVGVYQIDVVATTTLTLLRPVFPATEEGLRYRLFQERAKLSSLSTDTYSSIRVTGASEISSVVETQYGLIPQFEAVDKQGNKLSFDGVALGDTLRLVTSEEREIVGVYPNYIVLDAGLPSNLKGAGFEIEGSSAKSFNSMQAQLQSFTDSPSLLKKHGFDEDLTAVDNALTTAVLPGRNFASSRNRAKQILADLLSILTSQPRRSDEYTAVIPKAPLDMEDILSNYNVQVVAALDSVINSFVDRKYGRAVDLLKEGDLGEFFSTNEETGSYAGSVMAASRKVAGDLPSPASSAYIVDKEMNTASSSTSRVDANTNFDDTGFTE